MGGSGRLLKKVLAAYARNCRIEGQNARRWVGSAVSCSLKMRMPLRAERTWPQVSARLLGPRLPPRPEPLKAAEPVRSIGD